MTPTEIAQSLFFKLPVIHTKPNEKPIEYAYVKEIIYTHDRESGRNSVGLMLQDVRTNSFTIAYMQYCKLKNPCNEEPPEIVLPARIKKAFVEFRPCYWKDAESEGEWEEITKLIISLDSKNKVVVKCEFSNKYKLHTVLAKDVRVKPKKDCIDYKEIGELFFKHCHKKVIKWSESRRAAVKSAIADGVKLADLFKRVSGSDYLMNKWQNWGIDWVLKPANRLKILEGNYDNKTPEPPPPSESSFNIEELEEIK